MKQHTQLTRWVLAGCLCLNLCGTSFANTISIGRYLTVAAKPLPAQQHLLSQQIQIKFPENIFTVKQAIEFLLQFRGFRLASLQSMQPAAKAMLDQPLPEVDRTLGPMRLEDALLTLGGSPFYLLVDPVHRLVAYQLKPKYQSLYVSISQ